MVILVGLPLELRLNCTGNGTYSEHYVIDDLEIDGEASGSKDYFPLMKCPLSPPQESGRIPLELIILISILSGGAVIGITTFQLIRHKRKRIE